MAQIAAGQWQWTLGVSLRTVAAANFRRRMLPQLGVPQLYHAIASDEASRALRSVALISADLVVTYKVATSMIRSPYVLSRSPAYQRLSCPRLLGPYKVAARAKASD